MSVSEKVNDLLKIHTGVKLLNLTGCDCQYIWGFDEYTKLAILPSEALLCKNKKPTTKYYLQ